MKKPLPKKLTERLEKNKVEQRKRFTEAFPVVNAFGAADEAWDHITPDEVMGWKFNRVRERYLEPIRDRIAHMITQPSGDLSLSPDSRENTREVTKWISLLRFIVRVMITNENFRIPPPAPSFTIPPDAKHIDQLRRAVMGQKES